MIELALVVLLAAAPPAAKPFDARIDEAQRLRTRGLTDDALKLLDLVEADAKKKKDAVSEGRAKQKRGDLLFDASDCAGAKAQYEAAIKALGKADPIATAQAWNDLGMWSKRCATPDDQKVYFANALKLYEDLKYQKGIRLLANNLGSANFVGGDKTAALGYFKKAAAAARDGRRPGVAHGAGERGADGAAARAGQARSRVHRLHASGEERPRLSAGARGVQRGGERGAARGHHRPLGVREVRERLFAALRALFDRPVIRALKPAWPP